MLGGMRRGKVPVLLGGRKKKASIVHFGERKKEGGENIKGEENAFSFAGGERRKGKSCIGRGGLGRGEKKKVLIIS